MDHPTNFSNDEIANIYENILNGQKYSLVQLQNVNIYDAATPVIKRQHQNIVKNIKIEKKWDLSNQSQQSPVKDETNLQETVSAINLANKKEHYFLNALKAGVKLSDPAKNQTNHYVGKSRWVNSELQDYNIPQKRVKSHLRQNKRQLKGIKKDISQQLKINQDSDETPKIENKMSIMLPKVTINRSKETVDLPKVKSSQIQPLIKGNDVFQSLSPPRQQSKKPRKKFREIVGLTKKMRNDFELKNEEERRLQTEIMDYHSSTKSFLSAIFEKYGLNMNNKAKYTKKRKTISLEIQESSSQMLENSLQMPNSNISILSNQISKCQELNADLSQLTLQFRNTSLKLKQICEQLDSSSYIFYLSNHKGNIQQQEKQEQDQEEERDIITQDVPGQKQKYTDIMIRVKQKKWSLMQRTEYESHRKDMFSDSRKTPCFDDHGFANGQRNNPVNQQNKMVVNERLKNLLFS